LPCVEGFRGCLTTARVADIRPDGESVVYLRMICGTRCKNNFSRILALHFQAPHPCLELRAFRHQLGHKGLAGFVFGPDLEFSGVVGRSGQWILRKVRDRQAEAAVRRKISHISESPHNARRPARGPGSDSNRRENVAALHRLQASRPMAGASIHARSSADNGALASHCAMSSARL